MRFLDHIPTRKMILEAGIADAGVMLDRLALELVGLMKLIPGTEVSHATIARDNINGLRQKAMVAKEKIVPDTSAEIKSMAMDYSAAMWLTKMIRLEVVVLVDRELQVIPDFVSPSWQKYTSKVYRQFNMEGESAWDAPMSILHSSFATLEKWIHFGDMCRVSPEMARIPWEGAPGPLVSKLSAAEKEWQAKRPKSIPVTGRDKVLISDEQMGLPGWFWVYLDRSYCRDEANAMGHCGNESGSHLISLRHVTEYNQKTKQPIAWRPWATCSYIPNQKIIGQVKGPSNAKPAVDYDDHTPEVLARNRIVRTAIAHLFNWSEVHGFRQYSVDGYSDFRPDDLEDDLFDTLTTDRPGLFVGSMKNWIRTQGDDIKSLTAYVEHKRQQGSQTQVYNIAPKELYAFSPATIKAVIMGTDPQKLGESSVNWKSMSPEIFIKAFDNKYKTLMMYLEKCKKKTGDYNGTPVKLNMSVQTNDLRPFSKQALAKFFKEGKMGRDLSSVEAFLFVKAFGQTAKAADAFFEARNGYIADGNLVHFEGDALVRMHELAPTKFRLGSYTRLRKLQGDTASDVDLLKQFAQTGGEIKQSEFSNLDDADLKQIYEYAPQWFDTDLYLRRFGTDDMLVNEMISDMAEEINAEQFIEMSEEMRKAVVEFMVHNAPIPLGVTFSNTMQGGFNPANGLFVYRKFSNAFELADDKNFVDDSGYRRDNQLGWIAKVIGGDGDMDGDYWPHDKVYNFWDQVISHEEGAFIPEYVEEKYPEEYQEYDEDEGVDGPRDALKLLNDVDDDDSLIQALKYGYESGYRVGVESEMADTFWDAVSNKTKLSFDRQPLHILYDHEGQWKGEGAYDCKVETGFDQKTFAIMLQTPDMLDALVNDTIELDNKIYVHERDFYGFDDDAAWDTFYDNFEEGPTHDKMWAVRQALIKKEKEKNGIKESLAARLGWR